MQEKGNLECIKRAEGCRWDDEEAHAFIPCENTYLLPVAAFYGTSDGYLYSCIGSPIRKPDMASFDFEELIEDCISRAHSAGVEIN